MSLLLILLLLPLWTVDLVFLTEVVAGLARSRRRPEQALAPRIAILTPAHNEAPGICASVAAIRAVLPAVARQLVVAHNCGDATAAEARAGGAEVATLDRPDQRGKGYALAYGRERLTDDPPEVVIVVDADCTAEPGSFERLAATAVRRDRAVQACYLFRSRAGDAAMVQISNFAMLVKNLVRQRGGARIGAPALMTGSGMAFPWAQFARLDLATGNIVEDLAIGVELVEAGRAPLFEEQARIWSTPSSAAGTQTQRARWEGGFMRTARGMALPLLARGLRRGSWSETWMGLHLLVPPLTLVLLANAAVWMGLGVVALLGVAPPWLLSSILLAALLIAVLAAWASEGHRVLSAGTLMRLPLYLLWKVGLYLRLVRGREQAAWVRTERVD